MGVISLSFIIGLMLFVSYLMVSISLHSYINYFESVDILRNTSWGMGILIITMLIVYGLRQPTNQLKTAKSLYIIPCFLVITVFLIRFFIVNNVAVVYHLMNNHQVTVVAYTNGKHSVYYQSRGCKGKIYAFEGTELSDKFICEIKNEDWRALEPNTRIVLTGTKSDLGIHFERYAMLTDNNPLSVLHEIKSDSKAYYMDGVQDIVLRYTKPLGSD